MSTTTSKKTSKQDDCCACPVCGGLECLCRPRFFAGQLLTDEDLTRLLNYVIKKNRLTNRYLHGWGVVCGLQVVCNRCPGVVTVQSGYALSPCGDDIIVCEDDAVDICALIKKCKDAERVPPDCRTPGAVNRECPDEEEEWVLAIRYKEKPTRGITALLNKKEPPCCCYCKPGCKGDCGCRCHEKLNGNGSSANGNGCCSSKETPRQCEPTIVCESYDFDVYRAPPTEGIGDDGFELDDIPPGPLVDRFNKCLQQLVSRLPQYPGDDASQADVVTWMIGMKKALRQVFRENPTTICDWEDQLDAISVSSENVVESFLRLVYLVLEYLVKCLCSALLPPCPEPVCDDRVPLAVVTVRGCDCKIIRICNWTLHRKIVTSIPNIRYWLSPLRIAAFVRHILDWICCDFFGMRGIFDQIIRDLGSDETPNSTDQPQPGTPTPGGPSLSAGGAGSGSPPPPGDTGGGGAADPGSQPSRSFLESLLVSTPRASLKSTRFDQESSLLLDNLLLGKRGPLNAADLVKGLARGKDATGKPILSQAERSNLFSFVGLNFVANPHAELLAPQEIKTGRDLFRLLVDKDAKKGGIGELGDVLRNLFSTEARDEVSPDDLSDLRKTVESLQKTIADQQAVIEELQKQQKKEK